MPRANTTSTSGHESAAAGAAGPTSAGPRSSAENGDSTAQLKPARRRAFTSRSCHSTAADGISDAGAHVQQMAANCPRTKMVLGGYSQGAAV
ncbi:cutinase family protein, partial [Mycobacterium avium]|uniref:cutinase family protein n=1 Tax=Mycobacterium avium TaxID=1764 RepID=UPI0020C9D47F